MSVRIASFHLLIGYNGTGKSRLLKQLLSVNARNLIIPPNRFDNTWDDVKEIDIYPILSKVTGGKFDDFELFYRSKSQAMYKLHREFALALSKELRSFTGNKKIFIDHPEIFDIIQNDRIGFVNGGLFLDDFKDYIESNNMPANTRMLFSGRRHRMLDIFAATHGPDDIPPKMLNFNPVIIIFKTSGSFDSSSHKFEKFEELLAAKERVNANESPYHFEIIKP